MEVMVERLRAQPERFALRKQLVKWKTLRLCRRTGKV